MGGQSDHLAVVAAYEGWEFAKGQGRDRPFCAANYLSIGTLNMMAGLRQQLGGADEEMFRRPFLIGCSS